MLRRLPRASRCSDRIRAARSVRVHLDEAALEYAREGASGRKPNVKPAPVAELGTDDRVAVELQEQFVALGRRMALNGARVSEHLVQGAW